MKCERCGRNFPVDVPYRNVLNYPGSVVYSCPYCFKAYVFSSRVEVDIKPIEDKWIVDGSDDDWHRKIVKDVDYEQ